ncbi:MAG: YlmH/Sll1252 family protein [Lachnospiraceae bacterium]|nr:YlmH/Sll1252 family protein [Lachnospiraceae bacterium]
MEEKELLISKIKDLDRISYERDITKCTGFLTMSEQSVYLNMLKDLNSKNSFLHGGHEDADRAMIIWPASYADKEKITEDLISCILVLPEDSRFADELNHRDFLGALMNLGIERYCLGDILVNESTAYIFCVSEMTDFITENLTQVKHTAVKCRKVALSTCDFVPLFEETRVNVASERIDAVVAAVYNVSRTVAGRLISSEYVFIDGRVAKNAGVKVREGSRISVRNHGKFIYCGIDGTTKKQRLYVVVKKYV